MKAIIIIAVSLLLLTSSAMAQVVLKEGKKYKTWMETTTDLEYKSDPDPKKAGWKFKERKTRVYEEVNQDRKSEKNKNK
jgi:hypothetical protein